jgi:chemotaxis protein MotB
VLPEARPAPAGSGEDDNWGWLITFSDLVLQLFGVAVLAALGGAAAHVATTGTPTAAIAAPVPAAIVAAATQDDAATVSPTKPIAAEVHQVVASAEPVDPASLDGDAMPSRPAEDDRLPAPPRAAAPAVQTVAARPAPQDAELQAIGRYLEQLAARDRSLAAKVATREGAVVVEIGAMNGFRPGSVDPMPAMKPLLDEVRTLVTASPQLHVEISGHTDDKPIRTAQYPSNLELSLARASRIAQQLIGGDAALRTRISAAGYGEQRPIASNKDADGRAQNRRVEIRLTRAS